MITKDMFIEKLQHEVTILKHLAAKASTPELLNFRFSDVQRSTGEWLAYIALIGSLATRDILQDDASGFSDFVQRSKEFDITNFPDAIDTDIAKVIELVKQTSEEKLKEEKNQWGSVDTRAGHMLGVYDLYIVYKTQIFLQLKAAGLTDLGTSNLWSGIDTPAQS